MNVEENHRRDSYFGWRKTRESRVEERTLFDGVHTCKKEQHVTFKTHVVFTIQNEFHLTD